MHRIHRDVDVLCGADPGEPRCPMRNINRADIESIRVQDALLLGTSES